MFPVPQCVPEALGSLVLWPKEVVMMQRYGRFLLLVVTMVMALVLPPRPGEAHLHALLHQLGVEKASITQACADVQKGGMAVLLIAVSAEQLQTCFRPAA
jgi:type II secretory pathway component PulM